MSPLVVRVASHSGAEPGLYWRILCVKVAIAAPPHSHALTLTPAQKVEGKLATVRAMVNPNDDRWAQPIHPRIDAIACRREKRQSIHRCPALGERARWRSPIF